MHRLYRLRDALALTRPEITALWAISALLGLGVGVKHLPAPPETLDATVLVYEARFEEASLKKRGEGAEAGVIRADVEKDAEEAKPTPPSQAKAVQAAPVALNTATAAQLETLPRIGPKMAERILDYRARRGGFRTVDELRNVRGIGAKTLEKLRPFVTVD